MTDVTTNLALPELIAAQAQKHVTVNEALRALDALVQLAVLDRDLASPPTGSAEGARWIVASGASGDWAAHVDEIAAWQDGGWSFYAPRAGWLAYVVDEAALVVWSGDSWVAASSSAGDSTMTMLGIGTSADEDNPFSAKLNNALWVAKTIAEGGDGTLRYKMSKESADKTLSMLFQDNFSGRAEIGLTGDDDFHFKTSADGTTWVDALLLDKASGATKINAGFFLTGAITPAEITADQSDYNPTGLAGASILRLSADAARRLTGLSGGGSGRVIALLNAGDETITLRDENASSSAANRFGFGSDVVLAARQSAVLWYDGVDSRWTLVAGPPPASTGEGGGGEAGPADLELLLAQLAMGQADALNVALFVGENGNRFADSFETLAFVDESASSGIDTATVGQLGPSTADTTETSSASNNVTAIATGYTTMNRQWAVDNDKTVKSIGVYSAAAQEYVIKLFKRTGSGQYDVVYSQAGCNHPGGSVYVDFPLTSPYAIPNDGASYYAGHYTTGAKPNATASGEAVAYKAGSITGTAQSGFTESSSLGAPVVRATYQGLPSDAVIVSEPLSATTAPDTAKLAARVTYIDAITPGTDLIFEASRDDGTTWTEVDMTEKFTIGSIRILEGAETSLAAQPSGSDMRWRVSSDNNKRFALNDIYFYWN